MRDSIFAFFHFFLLVGIIVYAFYLLAQGDTSRFGLIAGCLIVYYLLVLHKPVKKEIRRRREERKNKEGMH
jgi:Ca2+/Na+ antiporter